MAGINLASRKTIDVIVPSPYPPETPAVKPVDKVTLTGIVKTGEQLAEEKSYCASGLYLVADEGGELVAGTGVKILLLRLPDETGETVMLSDRKYVGKKIEVTGKYPAQQVFCEALTCGCEDYILVDQINI